MLRPTDFFHFPFPLRVFNTHALPHRFSVPKEERTNLNRAIIKPAGLLATARSDVRLKKGFTGFYCVHHTASSQFISHNVFTRWMAFILTSRKLKFFSPWVIFLFDCRLQGCAGSSVALLSCLVLLSPLSLCAPASLLLTLTLLCLLSLNVSGGYPSPCYQSDRRIQWSTHSQPDVQSAGHQRKDSYFLLSFSPCQLFQSHGAHNAT